MRRLAALIIGVVIATFVPAQAEAHVVGSLPVIAFDDRYTPGGDDGPPLVLLQGSRMSLVNADGNPHSLTSVDIRNGAPLFDSGPIQPQSFGEVFGTHVLYQGTYAFRCVMRAGMQGTLTILKQIDRRTLEVPQVPFLPPLPDVPRRPLDGNVPTLPVEPPEPVLPPVPVEAAEGEVVTPVSLVYPVRCDEGPPYVPVCMTLSPWSLAYRVDPSEPSGCVSTKPGVGGICT